MEVEADSVPSASAAHSKTDPSKKNPLPTIRPDKRLLSYMQMTRDILQGLHNGKYTHGICFGMTYSSNYCLT